MNLNDFKLRAIKPGRKPLKLNDGLVQFRAISGSRERHIGSHIVEFYNVKGGSA